MTKQLVFDLVVNFPLVEFYLNGAIVKTYRAVIDNGAGCKHCALSKLHICNCVNCNNVIYIPVLDQPCL